MAGVAIVPVKEIFEERLNRDRHLRSFGCPLLLMTSRHHQTEARLDHQGFRILIFNFLERSLSKGDCLAIMIFNSLESSESKGDCLTIKLDLGGDETAKPPDPSSEDEQRSS